MIFILMRLMRCKIIDQNFHWGGRVSWLIEVHLTKCHIVLLFVLCYSLVRQGTKVLSKTIRSLPPPHPCVQCAAEHPAVLTTAALQAHTTQSVVCSHTCSIFLVCWHTY